MKYILEKLSYTPDKLKSIHIFLFNALEVLQKPENRQI